VRLKDETGWNILERMNHYKVPGVSAAVIENFKIAWAKGYRVADAETKAPVTEPRRHAASVLSSSALIAPKK
jgi:CubicO group peptidase (beta-lactamase class C family)